MNEIAEKLLKAQRALRWGDGWSDGLDGPRGEALQVVEEALFLFGFQRVIGTDSVERWVPLGEPGPEFYKK